MGEMIKMVVVLSILSVISGGGLGYLEKKLKPIQEKQIMEKVKGPAVKDLLKDASNDPVADRFKIQDGDEELTIFVGAIDGKPKILVLESNASGYGGKLELLVGIDTEEEKLSGIRVTTHTETAGLGSNAKDDPSFAAQFEGKSLEKSVAVVPDNGEISAIGGATITSRAVCKAANQAIKKYKELKPKLLEELKKVSQ
ncbi:MAG: FMN-binding protein [Desulfobacteraceae bacterium]|nr:FMN-binding protein [Desulfobacteraceae bacterium]